MKVNIWMEHISGWMISHRDASHTERQLGKALWQLEFISSRSTGLGVLGLPVTATRAPKALISVSTNVIPRYPEIEKMNDSPYAWTGFCENARNNNYKGRFIIYGDDRVG